MGSQLRTDSTADPSSKSSDGNEMDSADEALCELLGISSFCVPEETADDKLPTDAMEQFQQRIEATTDEGYLRSLCNGLREGFSDTSLCVLPEELSVPAAVIRRITDQVSVAP